MRRCEMCGAEIPSESMVCPNCGGTVSEESQGTERLIGNPEWGEIIIDLTDFAGDKENLFSTLKSCWNDLEFFSSQRLFAGQLSNIEWPQLHIVLYGPRESFLQLCKKVKGAGGEDSILKFHPMTLEEIYKIRETTS